MHMYQIEVKTDETGALLLIQDDGGEDAIIALHPDQVPIVCEWMMKAIGAKTVTREVKRLED